MRRTSVPAVATGVDSEFLPGRLSALAEETDSHVAGGGIAVPGWAGKA